MRADPRELHRLRTFYVGRPGGGDLLAAFIIDGRGYPTAEQVRADIAAAVAELHHRGLPAQLFTDPTGPGRPHPDLPTWQEWNGVQARGA